jgi:hypothetical protein
VETAPRLSSASTSGFDTTITEHGNISAFFRPSQAIVAASPGRRARKNNHWVDPSGE